MRKISYVNWGDIVREAMTTRVEQDGSRNLVET